MIQRQHNVSEPVHPFYIRTLISLEASVNDAIAKEKAAKKKLNATNAKALTAMKQKVKKAHKEQEAQIAKYQEVRSMIIHASLPPCLIVFVLRTLRLSKKTMLPPPRVKLLPPPLLRRGQLPPLSPMILSLP